MNGMRDNNFTLVKINSDICEQYEVYFGNDPNEMVASFFLRNGCFVVRLNSQSGELIYEARTYGGAMFEYHERDEQIRMGLKSVIVASRLHRLIDWELPLYTIVRDSQWLQERS